MLTSTVFVCVMIYDLIDVHINIINHEATSANDIMVSTKKVLNKDALKSPEPLTWYLTKLYLSDPGFRCGHGGSVSRHHPFVFSRLCSLVRDPVKRGKICLSFVLLE